MDRLYRDGYLHWKNRFAAESLKTFQDLNNFAQGLGILGSILASAQLQEFLRMWFAPSEGPPDYYIWVARDVRGVSAVEVGKSIRKRNCQGNEERYWDWLESGNGI
ncbi:hypothetical protein M0657_011553 [Pyricularia oryzae]|nr:hypothetical protein M0657_011553 [Pyricularia oryzae]